MFGIVVCDQSDLPVKVKGGPVSCLICSFSPSRPSEHAALIWLFLMFLILLFTFPFSAFTQMYQCPYCKFTNTDLNRLRMHVMTQHSVQPMLQCPLCQDMLNNKIHLQFHLTHLHSVAPDCVDKLIATVSSVLYNSFSLRRYPQPGERK